MNSVPRFIGRGDRDDVLKARPSAPQGDWSIGPWRRDESDDGSHEEKIRDHPRGYICSSDLADAVNTALLLGKPLLLTGRPGTGKSQLADRVAWEFGLSPVLRFEAQSISEAQDLFYRFDLVGRLAAVQLLQAHRTQSSGRLANVSDSDEISTNPEKFLSFGPLGQAILLANPAAYEDLLPVGLPGFSRDAGIPEPRPSIVLIDEIDKASRDFPNDLLNGIDRMELRLRELNDRVIRLGSGNDARRPIVIITSNSERELPEPFLRRCAYFHIEEPDADALAKIIRNRVFPELGPPSGDDSSEPVAVLPPLYGQLLDFFIHYRERHAAELSYRPGTSELIDWATAIRAEPQVDESKPLAEEPMQRVLLRKGSAMAKGPEDRGILARAISNFSRSVGFAAS